ncbi:hypothetical protein [Streptomyces mirabilis]|uniref:hypothetical protein n=1 Tax=Streptomyces mirabilis TaxID=68239 RepID=UPI0036B61F18
MALIATSVLGQDHGGREAEVREALAEAYGTDTNAWQPGALASGARAAREVARDLAAQSPVGG